MKRYILIAVIFFGIGVGLMYFVGQYQLQQDRALTSRILDNCVAGKVIEGKLVDNCQKSYNQVVSCVSNLSTCNGQQTLEQLSSFSKEKNNLETKAKVLEFQMDDIVVDAKKMLNK